MFICSDLGKVLYFMGMNCLWFFTFINCACNPEHLTVQTYILYFQKQFLSQHNMKICQVGWLESDSKESVICFQSERTILLFIHFILCFFSFFFFNLIYNYTYVGMNLCLHSTADSKLNNFTRLEPIFHLLGIPFDTTTARDIMTEKHGTATRLLYQMYIALNNKKKASLTGVAMQTLQSAAVAKLGAMESEMFKEVFAAFLYFHFIFCYFDWLSD